MSSENQAPVLQLVKTQAYEYVKDLPCGMSVYVGYSSRDLAWSWSVEGEESAFEEGFADTYEQAVSAARRAARKLLGESLQALRGGKE